MTVPKKSEEPLEHLFDPLWEWYEKPNGMWGERLKSVEGEQPGPSAAYERPYWREPTPDELWRNQEQGYILERKLYSDEELATMRGEADQWYEYYKTNAFLPYPERELFDAPRAQGWLASHYDVSSVDGYFNDTDDLRGGGGTVPREDRKGRAANPYWLNAEAQAVRRNTDEILAEAGLLASQLRVSRQSRGIGTEYMGKRDAASRRGLVNRRQRAIMLSHGGA